MASKKAAAKRRRAIDDHERRRQDRLSSLPDVILIGILSLLPLDTAIKTEVLSTRWRRLWTHVTSFDLQVNKRIFKSDPEFLSFFNQTLHKLTSPFFHRFSVEFCFIGRIPINSWLRQVFKRNIVHLRVTWPAVSSYDQFETPYFIFQMQSLVSLELGCAFDLLFSEDDINPVKLPKLKKLSLIFSPLQYQIVEKLIEGCPSLEELSFRIVGMYFPKDISIKCFSPTLRRLSIGLDFTENYKVTIDAPRLVYLATFACTSTKFCFGHKPIGLHEANIRLLGYENGTHECQIPNSKFYGAISSVNVLALNLRAMNPFTVFRNVSRLTLTLTLPCDLRTVVSRLKLFPKLNELILKFADWYTRNSLDKWILPSGPCARALRRIKRIDIDTWFHLDEPYKSEQYFTELAEYLLRSATSLEHFNVIVAARTSRGKEIVAKTRQESVQRGDFLRKTLRKCRIASIGCRVLFRGRYLSMPQNAGLKF